MKNARRNQEILRKSKAGMRQANIGKEYGIGQPTVSKILIKQGCRTGRRVMRNTKTNRMKADNGNPLMGRLVGIYPVGRKHFEAYAPKEV